MININDPVQAAKLFAELDPVEDPQGKQALKQVDFRQLGLFFPNKSYGSVEEAAQSLRQSKQRITDLLSVAKGK
jgi:hypothetical protein